MKAQRTPRGATTFEQICDRPRDNKSFGDYSLMIDVGVVYLTEQAWGGSPKQKLTMSRAAFNHLIDWYNNGERKCTRVEDANK